MGNNISKVTDSERNEVKNSIVVANNANIQPFPTHKSRRDEILVERKCSPTHINPVGATYLFIFNLKINNIEPIRIRINKKTK